MEETSIVLKRGKEESLLRYHPWVFSGAISHAEADVVEGEIVRVVDSAHNFIAKGHFQIGSIAVRVLTFRDEEIDEAWWMNRIGEAYGLRASLGLVNNGDTTCYRLIHGEGDSLPGLIVDIYGTTAVIQCHSVGMYLSRDIITAAITNIYNGRITSVYDKSSGTVPFNAGLNAVDHYLTGGSSAEPVSENGHSFSVSWEHGQKTGFFIDQRDNRSLVARYSQGRRVLNTFCYTGGFSVYALAGGAESVDSVDSSARAVELAAKNVEINFGSQNRHRAITADAFDYLKDIKGKYDLIILDPPAFAKHHKVSASALQGYKRLNAQALAQISRGGILFTFSCSQAVSKEQFRNAVFSAAAITGRNVRILHQLTQPADHPVNIYHPEGEYLKGLVLYVE